MHTIRNKIPTTIISHFCYNTKSYRYAGILDLRNKLVAILANPKVELILDFYKIVNFCYLFNQKQFIDYLKLTMYFLYRLMQKQLRNTLGSYNSPSRKVASAGLRLKTVGKFTIYVNPNSTKGTAVTPLRSMNSLKI